MRTITTATLAVAFAVLGASSTQATAPPEATTPAKELRNGCAKLYKQTYHELYSSDVYKRKTVSNQARKKLKRLRTCAHSAKAGRNMRKFEKTLKAERSYRRAVIALTPFRGPNGTRWAIPWPIVYCESGTSGLWRAANPSGAIGPYQLLGHGAPWPANTPAARLAHHRIARRLYLTQGSRPWVCA